MGSSALRALGLAVALASWALIWGDRSMWARLCVGLALAVMVDVSTYVLVRGL
jgi:hypothetical protein